MFSDYLSVVVFVLLAFVPKLYIYIYIYLAYGIFRISINIIFIISDKAVKRFIVINLIQNKGLYLHNAA